MRTILVANPKGGSGKTTLATNIAGWLAGKRQRVVLADNDRQQTATQWLARRPALFPRIAGLAADATKKDLKEFDWCVVDSAAGLRGEDLRESTRIADVMLVPVSPSAFDIAATARFLATVSETKAVRQGMLPLGLVAMRERAAIVGGTIEFLMVPEGGTVVRLTVPLQTGSSVDLPPSPGSGETRRSASRGGGEARRARQA